MAETPNLAQILPSETTIAGPISYFNDSFVVEYLKPDPARNASSLLKARYVANHPEIKLGKKYAQVPPYHLHFLQIESFVVLQGRVGNTTGWERTDHVWTAKDGIQKVEKWMPHTFWPVRPDEHPESANEADVDPIMLVWAHPKLPGERGEGVFPPNIDYLFFQSVLGYVSDVHEGKEKLDISLLMLMQQETETAPIMLSSWWILGPLRWWLPYRFQGALAALARWQGKVPVLEKYVGKENFEKWAKVEGKVKSN